MLGSPTLPASAQLIYLLGNFTLCQLVLSTSRSASGKGMRWCGGVGVERVGVFVCTTSVLEGVGGWVNKLESESVKQCALGTN